MPKTRRRRRRAFCFRARIAMHVVGFEDSSLHDPRLIGRRRLTPRRAALMQIRHGLYSRPVVVFLFHPPPPSDYFVFFFFSLSLSLFLSHRVSQSADTYPHADGNSADDDVVQEA
ncbi:hypothetical protein ACS0PU_010517 [Formica fusca]